MTTQQKHTPEPWCLGPSASSTEIYSNITKTHVATLQTRGGNTLNQVHANGPRIVSCVNALAGILDPEEFVKASKGLVLSIKSVLQIWGSDEGLEKSILKKAIARAEAAFGKTRKEEI